MAVVPKVIILNQFEFYEHFSILLLVKCYREWLEYFDRLLTGC